MTEGIRCARCNRRLKHPHWVGLHAYGSVCIKKIEAESQAVLFEDAPEPVAV